MKTPTRLQREDIFFRVWIGKLTAPQYRVMAFLFDRIVRWNNEDEVIYLRQLVEGVTGSDGRVWSAGACDSIPTAKRIMAELVKLGIILKQPAGMSNRVTINFNWGTEDMPHQP